MPLVLLQVVWMLFARTEGENLLLAFPDEDIAHVLDRTQRFLLLAALAATVLVIGLRWWRASAPRRRALLPSIAGALTLLMFGALLTNDLVTGERSEVLLWATACSLVLVPLAFLAGLLRSRLARGALADLFRNIGGARPDELRPALARALGDPNLAIGYRQPDASYLDAGGRAVAADPPERSLAHVERDGRPLGAIVYDASLDDDPELVEAVTAAAAIAIDNARLLAETESQLAEIKASRERIVAAGTPSGGGWSATSTTARSSVWSGSRSSCGCSRTASGTTRRRRSSSRPPATSSPTRSPSCASWRAASTRPCSSTACTRRSTRSPRAHRCRPASTTG